MRLVVLITGAAVLALGAGGCESTQTKSKRLAKTGAKQSATKTISAGKANPDVKVAGATVLTSKDSSGHAVVVELDDVGRAEAAVPIQIVAKDAAGKQLYKNDLD